MAYLNSYSHLSYMEIMNGLELATTLVWHDTVGQTVPTAALGISIHQMGTTGLCWKSWDKQNAEQALTEMEGKMHLSSHFVLEKICAATANALNKKQVNQLILFEELEGGTLAENCYYQNTQFMPFMYVITVHSIGELQV